MPETGTQDDALDTGRVGARLKTIRVHDAALRVVLLVGVATIIAFLALWNVKPFGPVSFWLIQLMQDAVFIYFCRELTRSPLTAAVRRFWQRVTLTGVLFAVADSLQTVLAVAYGDRFTMGTTVTRVLVGAALGCLMWALVGYPTGASGRGQLQWWLDAATIMASAGGLVWALVWASTTGDITGVSWLISTVVISGIALICVVGLVKLRYAHTAPFSAAAGNSAVLAGVIFAMSIVAEGTEQVPSNVAAALRLAAGFTFITVPRIELLRRRTATDDSSWRRERRIPHRAVPYFALAVVLVLLLAVLVYEDLTVPAWGLIIAVMVATSTGSARQFVTLTDNDRLLSRLDAAVKETQQQEQRFRRLVQYAWDVTLVVDTNGVITYASPSVHRLLGYRADEVVGRRDESLVHHEDRTALSRARQRLSWQPYGASVTTDVRIRHADRNWRWFEVVCTNLLEDPHISAVVYNVRDVTETRRLERQLRYDATHDPLTRLANRALLNEQVHGAPTEGPDAEQPAAAIAIDLDDFKTVNDRFGHAVGDALLVAVAGRLRSCVRPQDTIARLGGDEFAILLVGERDADAAHVAERIDRVLREPISIDGRQLHTVASIGLATGTRAELSYLLRSADAAMYKRKKRAAGQLRAGDVTAPTSSQPSSQTPAS